MWAEKWQKLCELKNQIWVEISVLILISKQIIFQCVLVHSHGGNHLFLFAPISCSVLIRYLSHVSVSIFRTDCSLIRDLEQACCGRSIDTCWWINTWRGKGFVNCRVSPASVITAPIFITLPMKNTSLPSLNGADAGREDVDEWKKESIHGRDPCSRIQWDTYLECRFPPQTERILISGPLQVEQPLFGRSDKGDKPASAPSVF